MLTETKEMTIKEIKNKLWDVYLDLKEKHNFTLGSLTIKISKRLRCQAGNCLPNRILDHYIITVSKPLLDEFGWERFEKNFRHELAHAYCEKIYGNTGHKDPFKRICVLFGGSMNRKMAGTRYKEAASKEYTKTIKKWKYICPCGVSIERAKRMSYKIRKSPFRTCRTCGTAVVYSKEERI